MGSRRGDSLPRHLGVFQQTLTRLKPRLDALPKILLRPTEVPNEATSVVVQSDPSAPGLLGAMGALAFGVRLDEAVLGASMCNPPKNARDTVQVHVQEWSFFL